MPNYIFRRFVLGLAVALTVSVLGFALLRLSGDLAQAIAGINATAEDVERVRILHGLDRPLLTQYLDWLLKVLTGDFGGSVFFHSDVSSLLLDALPVTMTLGLISIVIVLVVGLPLGVLAAVYKGTLVDKLAQFVSVLGQALPSFWFSMILIITFGVVLRWLPISGTQSWKSYILPAIALSVYSLPAVIRLTRSGMLEVLTADYIRTARAKGVPPRRIVIRHALRNAVMPVVSIAAVKFGYMLGGSVVIESTFALHGIGYLGYQSVMRADFPVVQAVVLVLAAIFVVVIFLADVLNAFIDPRVRGRS